MCKGLTDMINLPINQYLRNAPIWWPGEREIFLTQVGGQEMQMGQCIYIYIYIYMYTQKCPYSLFFYLKAF